MRLPSYSAEKSLYKTTNAYIGTQQHQPIVGVIPQLMSLGTCLFNCEPDDIFCAVRCSLDNPPIGSGGGGGGGPLCRPQCSRCTRDPESPTGRSRVCILRNCDDVTRPC